MKILSVVNPVSGGVDKQPAINYINKCTQYYGIDSHIYQSNGKDDDENIVRLIEEFKPDKIVTVGGDGTTLEVASIIKDYQIPLGIVPMGSANGLAMELGVRGDYRDAFNEILMSNLTCQLDMVKVNGEHLSIHIGDVGLNANIIKGYEAEKSRGMLAYAKHFFRSLGENKVIDVTIETDEGNYEARGYMVAIANSRKYGTGVILNDKGNPLDGRFEIVILKEMNITYLLQAGLSALNETFAAHDNIFSVSCKKAKLTFNSPQELQLDGEMIGQFEEISVEIMPAAVKLITTQNNPFLK